MALFRAAHSGHFEFLVPLFAIGDEKLLLLIEQGFLRVIDGVQVLVDYFELRIVRTEKFLASQRSRQVHETFKSTRSVEARLQYLNIALDQFGSDVQAAFLLRQMRGAPAPVLPR
jgi:hypothetical protein